MAEYWLRHAVNIHFAHPGFIFQYTDVFSDIAATRELIGPGKTVFGVDFGAG